VKDAIGEILQEQASFTGGEVARRLGVTRQAVHATLQQLVAKRELVLEGVGRGARYRAGSRTLTRTYATRGLEEHVVWRETAGSEPVRSLRGNALAIVEYAFTEILNNAIEHSGASRVTVRVGTENGRISFDITDRGVGIFERVRVGLGLATDLEALQELSKGKVTTRPEHHTGEGVFFVTKCGDWVQIASGRLLWTIDNLREDQTVAFAAKQRGTRVHFVLAARTKRRLRDVFDAYTREFEFDRTRIVIKLFEIGTTFVSRSEAKRLTERLDRFGEAILDFRGVESVGQGFADEVFRVWALAHPKTRLLPVNMSGAVEYMVVRATAPRV
jgi:hypothetical protein